MNILVEWLDLGTIVDMFIFRNSADRTRIVYISHDSHPLKINLAIKNINVIGETT